MTAIGKRGTISRGLFIPPYSSIMSNNDTGSWSYEFVQKNSTIIDRMIDIHLEQAEENVRNGPFVKCNYIEELVEKENLNYVTLAIYPSNYFFFIKNPDMKQYFLNLEMNEDEEILDFINNEEISTSLVALLDKHDWKLMYDYHVILQIQKFTTEEEGNDPLFCTFVLLKPTDRVRNHYIFKWYSSEEKKVLMEQTEAKRIKRELKNKNESEILFKMCPPLYLGTDQTALDIIYLRGSYGNLSFVNRKFASKHSQNQDSEFLKTNEMILHPKESSAEKFCKNELMGFYFIDLKEELHSVLVSRKINSDNLKMNCLILVEVFYFEFSEESNSNKSIKDEISVSMRNGLFYTLKSVFDNSKNRPLYCVGSREELDRYILAFSETASKKFCRRMCIKHKNCLDEKSSVTPIFTCGEKVYSFGEELDKKFNESSMDVCNNSSSAMETSGIEVTVNKNAAINNVSSSNMPQEYIHSGVRHKQTDTQKLNEQDQKIDESITGFQVQMKQDKNPSPSFSTITDKEKIYYSSNVPIFECTIEELWSI